MKQVIQKNLFIFLGWLSVLLGTIGIVLPILPTTPFLILALALFVNSSPRFHQMLLDNHWFGATLKQWDKTKTVTRRVKVRASLLVFLSFSISIVVLHERFALQFMLLVLGAILFLFIWRLKE